MKVTDLWARFVRALVRPFRRDLIRVWKLGSAEHRIVPTEKAVSHLASLLFQAKPGEDYDLIWDDMITVQELQGNGSLNIVTGPGIRITREGNVVKVEKEEKDW